MYGNRRFPLADITIKNGRNLLNTRVVLSICFSRLEILLVERANVTGRYGSRFKNLPFLALTYGAAVQLNCWLG